MFIFGNNQSQIHCMQPIPQGQLPFRYTPMRGELICDSLVMSYFKTRTDQNNEVTVTRVLPVVAPNLLFRCSGFALFTWPRFGYSVPLSEMHKVLQDEFIKIPNKRVKTLDLIAGIDAKNHHQHLARLFYIGKTLFSRETLVIHKPGGYPARICSIQEMMLLFPKNSWSVYREKSWHSQPSLIDLLKLCFNSQCSYGPEALPEQAYDEALLDKPL